MRNNNTNFVRQIYVIRHSERTEAAVRAPPRTRATAAAPDGIDPPVSHVLVNVSFRGSPMSVLRKNSRCAFFALMSTSTTRSPAPLQANTRDASRPTLISQAYGHPPPIDGGILISVSLRIPAEDPVRQAPMRCADALGCNVLPSTSVSLASVPRTPESSSLSTPAESFRSRARKSHLL